MSKRLLDYVHKSD